MLTHYRTRRSIDKKSLTSVFAITVLSLFISITGCSSKPKRPLTADDRIRREMALHLDEHEACFKDYQKRKGAIYGDLALQFEIQKDGRVSWVKVREEQSNLHDPELRRCMSASIKKIQFPSELADRPVVVDSYPFHFRR